VKTLNQDAVIIHSQEGREEVASRMISIRSAEGAAWVISVGLIGEGVDIPPIKVIIDLSDEITRRSIIQRWGRALRKMKKAKDLTATIYHVNHPMLRFVAKSLKREMPVLKKEKVKKPGPGPGEPSLKRGYCEGVETETLLDEVMYTVSVNDLAEWLFDTRDTIADFTDALKIARELIGMKMVPAGFEVREEKASSRPPTSRERKKAKMNLAKEHRAFIARQAYPGTSSKDAAKAVNSSVSYALVCRGLTAGTSEYRKQMYVLLEQRARGLGWVPVKEEEEAA